MEGSIQKRLDDSLLSEREARRNRQRSGKFSPSLLGRCYRLQYWNRKDEEASNPLTVNTLRRFKVGDLFHKFIQDLFPEKEVEVVIETEDIKGFADLVVGDEVIDIKSAHSRMFWHMKKDGYDINKEKFPNILQVMTYVYLLGKEKGRLIYVSKDDLYMEEYGFHIDQWKAKVEQELKTLRDLWSKGVLPEAKPRAFNGKECDYCPFKDKCFELEENNGREKPNKRNDL